MLLILAVALLFTVGHGAVVLTANERNGYKDLRSEALSSATLFFVDDLPILHWGEASPEPIVASNSIYDGAPVAAYATYDRAGHNQTGWGKLWITTTANVPMLDAMYAAGTLHFKLSYDVLSLGPTFGQ